jgi:hypothetical protein
LSAAVVTFFVCLIVVPVVLALLRAIGLYAIVHEGTCHVYVLFGKVIGVLKEPGFYILPFKLGPAAFIGRARVVPLRNMGAAISPFNAFHFPERHSADAEPRWSKPSSAPSSSTTAWTKRGSSSTVS